MSELLQGTIANINNKYVILDDKHFIEENFLLYTLLPNDIVSYFINDANKITIVSLDRRETQFIMGIIKSIDKNVNIYCPGFPKFFSPIIPFDIGYEVGTVLILKVTTAKIECVYFYNSIKNRRNDKELFLQLYRLNTEHKILLPEYSFNNKNNYTTHFKDLTHLDTFNVDPVQSKDFDDAISVEDDKIYVHIVDADSQIEPNSIVDKDALNKSFTLYLSEHVENILPPELSEDKMSLIKGKERKVITVEMTINKTSKEIESYEIYPSTIIIKNRYNYEEFNELITNFYNDTKLSILLQFCEKWKKPTLNIPHIKMNIDHITGKLIDFKFETNNDVAHKIIETLMIATNSIISKHVDVPQRYHSKIKGKFNVHFFSGNEIIDSILTVKKYKPAIYDSTNHGHFGLGLKTYTHFTSPIRRYFDVIIHRLLSGKKYNNLDNILNHINKREVYIEKLVDLYEKLKIFDYLERNIHITFIGYVVGITKVGIDVLLEKFLFNIFIFVPQDKNQYEIGDKVFIKIKSIDWLTLNIKAQLVLTFNN